MKDNNNLLIGIIIAVAVFLLLGMFGFGGMMGGGYGIMGNWGYGFGGMWIFGFLFMALILVALILFILWLIKQLQNAEKIQKPLERLKRKGISFVNEKLVKIEPEKNIIKTNKNNFNYDYLIISL